MRYDLETDLADTEQHIVQSELHLRQQRRLAEQSRGLDRAGEELEAVLQTFEQLIAPHRHHLKIIRRERPLLPVTSSMVMASAPKGKRTPTLPMAHLSFRDRRRLK